jgi:hypothetical protein
VNAWSTDDGMDIGTLFAAGAEYREWPYHTPDESYASY